MGKIEEILIKYNKKITIFTGHFGSGKTEAALNYAAALSLYFARTTASLPAESSAAIAPMVAIADMDIVNPYFRTADAAAKMEALGIIPIIPQYAGTNSDVPALPARLNMIFETDGLYSVLDTGGDETGARVLAGYRERIVATGYQMFFVVNTMRPETSSVSCINNLMDAVEAYSGLHITALINNTNLMDKTTPDTPAEGFVTIREAASRKGLEVAFSTIMKNVMKNSKVVVPLIERGEKVLLMDRFLKTF